MRVLEAAAMAAGELAEQERVRGGHAIGVQNGLERGGVAGIGERQRERELRRIAVAIGDEMAGQRGEAGRQRERPVFAAIAREPQQRIGERALRGVPAVDRIGVVRREEDDLVVAVIVGDAHGAEKPRSSDGTGGASTPTKRNDWRLSRTSSTRVVGPGASRLRG
jgi:hypothetical protein